MSLSLNYSRQLKILEISLCHLADFDKEENPISYVNYEEL